MSQSSVLLRMTNKMDQKERYLKDRRLYGYLSSLPILIAIVHLFFTLFFMTTVNYHEDTNTFANLYTIGEMYSASALAGVLIGLKPSLSLMKAIPGLAGILFGLVMIFLSTFAVKGKKVYYYISMGVYLSDTILMIPTIILSFTLKTIVHLQVYDIILMILIHGLFLAIYVYGIFVIRRLTRYEETKAIEESTIHIQKGN
jgi:hypothetical protein